MWAKRHRSYLVENLTWNIIAALLHAKSKPVIESPSWTARDRSRTASKSYLRNGYRKVEITLNSNSVGGAYRTNGGYPPSMAVRGGGATGEGRRGRAPEVALTLASRQLESRNRDYGEAKSVRVMGHRHAISPAFPLPAYAAPLAILTFNFALQLPRAPPPTLLHRCTSSPSPAWQSVALWLIGSNYSPARKRVGRRSDLPPS